MLRLTILSLFSVLLISCGTGFASPTSCPTTFSSQNPDPSFWQMGAPVIPNGANLAKIIIISVDGTAKGEVQCQYNLYGVPIYGYQSKVNVEANNQDNWQQEGTGVNFKLVCKSNQAADCTYKQV